MPEKELSFNPKDEVQKQESIVSEAGPVEQEITDPDWKRYEDEAVNLNKERVKETVRKAIYELYGAIAHEVNQPFTVLLGSAQLIEVYDTLDNPALAQSLQKIVQATHEISNRYTSGMDSIINTEVDSRVKGTTGTHAEISEIVSHIAHTEAEILRDALIRMQSDVDAIIALSADKEWEVNATAMMTGWHRLVESVRKLHDVKRYVNQHYAGDSYIVDLDAASKELEA